MRGITVIRQLAQRIGRSKAKNTLSHKQLNLVSKTEQTPWTKTWIHLFELPYRERVKVYREKDARERYEGLAAVKDRIKKWNIVPGDLVRVRGDRDHTIREVFGVNKFKNRVYFKESQVLSFIPTSESPGFCSFILTRIHQKTNLELHLIQLANFTLGTDSSLLNRERKRSRRCRMFISPI